MKAIVMTSTVGRTAKMSYGISDNGYAYSAKSVIYNGEILYYIHEVLEDINPDVMTGYSCRLKVIEMLKANPDWEGTALFRGREIYVGRDMMSKIVLAHFNPKAKAKRRQIVPGRSQEIYDYLRENRKPKFIDLGRGSDLAKLPHYIVDIRTLNIKGGKYHYKEVVEQETTPIAPKSEPVPAPKTSTVRVCQCGHSDVATAAVATQVVKNAGSVASIIAALMSGKKIRFEISIE